MAVTQLLPNLYYQFFGVTGAFLGLPLNGGSLYSYAAGTVTPLATYTDNSGATPSTNPIVLNSVGAANIWISTSAYKFVLKDSNGVTQWTVDNVSYLNPASITGPLLAASVAGIALLQNGSGNLDVQVDSATMQVVGNQLAVKTITGSNVATTSKLEVLSKNVRDYSCPGLYTQIPQYEWSAPTLLANPGSLPPGAAYQTRWSPNGEFLAVASTTTPYLKIYQCQGTVLNFLTVGAVGAATIKWLSWSPCGDFLAWGGAVKNFGVLQRVGNTFSAVTCDISATIIYGASGHINSVAWSPNSDFLMVSGFGGSSGLGIAVMERNGTTFTDVTSTSTITGAGLCTAWSPDSWLFAAIDNSTNLIDVWSRKDNIFTGITPPVITSYANDVVDMAFSPDGQFLAIAINVTPYVLLFTVTAGVFAQLANPATLPAGAANCVSWSANSEYLAVGHATTPFMTIYSVSGTTFTKIADPSNLPAAAVVGADFSPTKQFLAVAGGTTPYIQIYETASTLPSNSLLWSRGVPQV